MATQDDLYNRLGQLINVIEQQSFQNNGGNTNIYGNRYVGYGGFSGDSQGKFSNYYISGQNSGRLDQIFNTKMRNFEGQYNKLLNEEKERMRRMGYSEQRIDYEMSRHPFEKTDVGKRMIDTYSKYSRQANAISTTYGLANNVKNILQAEAEKNRELLRAELDAIQAITKSGIDMANTNISNGLDAVKDAFAGDVKHLGFDAFKRQMNLAEQSLKYSNLFSIQKQGINDLETIKNEEYAIDQLTNYAKLFGDLAIGASHELAFTDAKLRANKGDGNYSELIDANLESSAQFTQSIQEMYGIAEELKGFTKEFVEMRKDMMALNREQQKAMQEISEQIMGQVKDSISKVTDLIEVVSDYLMEADKLTKQEALEFGYIGKQGETYTKLMLQQNLIAAKWGKDIKDIVENQKTYIDNAGRNVMLSGTDQDKIFAAARLYGMEGTEMSTLMGDMNIFNTSITDGTNNMREMYDLANEIGVSNRRFAKDLNNNLKLAQKYNFVGGTKAMEKMSLWAQQVRMNLSTATSFAEKMIDGGIEDTLETSAKLQVLGGNAAIYSDPLGMLYDSGADTEVLAKRMEAMVGNFGTLDARTGETKFGWTDTKMIRELAKAMGMDPEEAMNMNREKNKFSVVRRQMLNTGLDEQQMRLISNRSTFDEASGKFKVTMLDGTTRDVGSLTAADLSAIKPSDNDEALVDYAQRSLDVETQLLVVQKKMAAKAGIDQEDIWRQSMMEQNEITRRYSSNIVGLVNKYAPTQYALNNQALESQFDSAITADKNGLFDNYYSYMEEQIANTADSVNKLNNEFIELTSAVRNGTLAIEKFLIKYGVQMESKDMVNQGYAIGYSKEAKRTGNDSLPIKTYLQYGTNRSIVDMIGRNNGYQQEGYTPYYNNIPFINNGFGHGFENYAIPSRRVVEINDGEIEMAKPSRFDRLYAAKSGGTLDESLKVIAGYVSSINSQMNSGVNNKVVVDGTISLKDRDHGNIVSSLGRDSEAMNQLLQLISDTLSSHKNMRPKGGIGGSVRNL